MNLKLEATLGSLAYAVSGLFQEGLGPEVTSTDGVATASLALLTKFLLRNSHAVTKVNMATLNRSYEVVQLG